MFVCNLIDRRNDVHDERNHAVQSSGFLSKFRIFAYFSFCNCLYEIIFFSDMARVVLHGTLFLLSINLLTIALDQWEGEFLQLAPSRTRALFFVQEKNC